MQQTVHTNVSEVLQVPPPLSHRVGPLQLQQGGHSEAGTGTSFFSLIFGSLHSPLFSALATKDTWEASMVFTPPGCLLSALLPELSF